MVMFKKKAREVGTPDIIQVPSTWAAHFADQRFIIPLRYNWINSNIYPQKAWKTCELVENEVFCVPWIIESRALFYRKDVFSAASIDQAPQTWEELEKLSRRLRKQGIRIDIDIRKISDEYVFIPSENGKSKLVLSNTYLAEIFSLKLVKAP